jgi:hypothetical protein
VPARAAYVKPLLQGCPGGAAKLALYNRLQSVGHTRPHEIGACMHAIFVSFSLFISLTTTRLAGTVVAFESAYPVYTAIPLLAHGIGVELGVFSACSLVRQSCAQAVYDGGASASIRDVVATANVMTDDTGCAFVSNEDDPAPTLTSVIVSASLKGSAAMLGESLASLVALRPAILVVLVTDAPDKGAAKAFASSTARVASALLASKTAVDSRQSVLDREKAEENATKVERSPPLLDSVYFFDSETTRAVESVLRDLEGRGILSFASTSLISNASTIKGDGKTEKEGLQRPEIFAFHWLPRIVQLDVPTAAGGSAGLRGGGGVPDASSQQQQQQISSNAAAAASALLQYSLDMKGHIHALLPARMNSDSNGPSDAAAGAYATGSSADSATADPLVARNLIQRRGLGLLQILASVSEATSSHQLDAEPERRAAIEKLLLYANKLCFGRKASSFQSSESQLKDHEMPAGSVNHTLQQPELGDRMKAPSIMGACWFLSLIQNIPIAEEGRVESSNATVGSAEPMESAHQPTAASVDYFVQLSMGLHAQHREREGKGSTEREDSSMVSLDTAATAGAERSSETDRGEIETAAGIASLLPMPNSDPSETSAASASERIVQRFHSLLEDLLASPSAPPHYPRSPFPSLSLEDPFLAATTASASGEAAEGSSSRAQEVSNLESLLDKEQSFALTLLELISLLGAPELCEVTPRLSPSKLAALTELLHIAGGGWADMIVAAASSRGSPPIACALLAYSPFTYAYVNVKDMYDANGWVAGIYLKTVRVW